MLIVEDLNWIQAAYANVSDSRFTSFLLHQHHHNHHHLQVCLSSGEPGELSQIISAFVFLGC